MEYRLRPWVLWNFLQNNRQLRRWNESKLKNTKNTDKKSLGFRLCGVLSVWVSTYACMCYSYVWMRVFRRLSQATNAARWVSGHEFECIFIIRYIILFLCVLMTIAMEQNIITACRGEWIRIWFVSVFERFTMGISKVILYCDVISWCNI